MAPWYVRLARHGDGTDSVEAGRIVDCAAGTTFWSCLFVGDVSYTAQRVAQAYLMLVGGHAPSLATLRAYAQSPHHTYAEIHHAVDNVTDFVKNWIDPEISRLAPAASAFYALLGEHYGLDRAAIARISVAINYLPLTQPK